MLNINLGRNKELMEQCHTLLEYAQFVDRLRTCEKSMGREEAVKHTVDTCIGEGKLVGEEQRLFRQVCTKLKKGKTQEVIAEELEENLSTIRSICEAAEEFAPEYDWKKVMEKTGAYVEKKC